MHISKLSAVALALAIPSLVIPTSGTAFVPSLTSAAVVDATTPVDDPVLKAATTEPPEDATPEDPMNGYNGQVQLGGDAEDLGFTLPKTILIPWEGEESELSPDQVADLEDAGVDLSAEQPGAPVEPIPDELVERAGACEMELGENVRDALEQCADDTSASASSNEDSATRTAASPMAAAAFDTSRAETRMSSVAQTNDPGDESGEEDVSEDDELPPGTAAGWGIQLDQPATSPCVTNQEQQLYITRTSSCFAYDVWAGVYQAGTGSIIGTYILTILNTTTTQASGGMVISNATSIRKSQPSGAALNRTMNVSATYGCSTPGCSTSTPNYRGSSDGWWNTAKGSTTMNLSARSAATVTENWKITISLSGLSGSGTYNGLAMKPRCDNAAVGLSGKGCVFANYVGWFKTPTTGETAQVGQHIVKAAAAGLPQVLTRADPSQRPINSRNTCPSVSWLPRDAGYQCDEYPFASTVQGGSTNVMVPQGCRWQATSPAGYGASRCMVLSGHNSKAGTLLGNFYRDNRIRPGDKFFVQVA